MEIQLHLSKQPKVEHRYHKITKQYMGDQDLGKTLLVHQACIQLDEINTKTYPILLSQLNIMRPDVMIFIGDIESNLVLYYQEEAFGVWGCMTMTEEMKCTTSTIVICECAPLYQEGKTNGGVWILSHELAHFLFYYENFGINVYAESVHVVENKYRKCLEDRFTNSCEQYYVQIKVDGESYNLMNLDFIRSEHSSLQIPRYYVK